MSQTGLKTGEVDLDLQDKIGLEIKGGFTMLPVNIFSKFKMI